ncbi:MAG: hypothetical protein CVV18_06255 [Gammaproteobacteria bacterium HGW-Gammaproteobacteria-8]|nr:MAG: hypothetical protein CVV18_06255 [Gammaproteobacteria bacterium HGW-Gammaproteobacteria-8]
MDPDDGAAWIRISLAQQRLELLENGRLVRQYAVSTAANGAGEANGSGCTPRGWHEIRVKIGAGCAHGEFWTRFRGW